ncbi:MAG TPA: hypothetical protein VNS32_17905, partial [Flavisolibacter sp.]|nr:hypothetical protein [Flavisolibacter sp.]
DATEKSGLEASALDNVINFLETPLHLLRFLSPWILFLLFLPQMKKIRVPDWVYVLLLIVGINILPYLFTAHSKANYMYPLNPFIAILLAWFYTQLKGYAVKTNKVLETVFHVLIWIVGAAIIAAPFIKEIKVALPSAWAYSLCLAVAVFAVAFYYNRLKDYRIYLFILFWILLKLAVTAFYNPALQYGSPEQHYKEYVQKAIQKAGPHNIYLWGDSSIEKAKVALGQIKIDTVKYVAPTYIIFTVPFYYSSLTHSVMEFSPFMKKDSIYMYVTDKKLVSDKVQVLDVTQPNSENKDLFYLLRPLEDIPLEPKNAGAFVRFE